MAGVTDVLVVGSGPAGLTPWPGYVRVNTADPEPDAGPDGSRTILAELLAPGRPVLLDLAGLGLLPGRLTVHSGECRDHPRLRGLLVRPDGHTVWVSPPMSRSALDRALAGWHWSDG